MKTESLRYGKHLCASDHDSIAVNLLFQRDAALSKGVDLPLKFRDVLVSHAGIVQITLY